MRAKLTGWLSVPAACVGPAVLVALAHLAVGPLAGDAVPDPSLHVWGALREVMHGGELSARVALADVPRGPIAIGVGALAGLDGEITILDGRVWLARPGGRLEVGEAVAADAALLVLYVGGREREAVLTESVPAERFDEAIATAASDVGIDPDRPFGFVIEGQLTDLAWHVVDGSKLTAGAGHAEHRRSGESLRRERVRATLVGLYSRSHAGVFTHHDSSTHVHAILDDTTPSGHVDRVALPAGTTILFRGPD